jgi:hypothetical protein
MAVHQDALQKQNICNHCTLTFILSVLKLGDASFICGPVAQQKEITIDQKMNGLIRVIFPYKSRYDICIVQRHCTNRSIAIRIITCR